jgi:NADH dehydrogenase
VGAGFGGLAAARRLAGVPVDVTVVDARNHHTFQALLYQVATAGLDPGDIAFSIRGVFQRQDNVDVHLGRVVGADLDGRKLLMENGQALPYDLLVLAAGSSTSYLHVAGAEEHALAVKSLPEAVRLRSHILAQFERAAGAPSAIDEGVLTFVVVGGGSTGVELAGAITELFTVMARDFRRVDVGQARVVLLEAGDELLVGFHPQSRRRALAGLRARGVDVRLGVRVSQVTPEAVHLEDGKVIASRTVAWSAGVRANPLADALGLEQGPGGRVIVGGELSVANRPEVFVVGDMAAASRPEGGFHPQRAPEAIQQGEHVADQIRRQVTGEPRTAFEARREALAVTIGRNDAVAELASGLRFGGRIAWLLWLRLHLARIIEVRNRLQVVLEWAWGYVTYDRAARLIEEPTEEW